jgi:hypothetical protein
MKPALTAFAIWIICGLMLLSLNHYCSGSECSTEAWFLTILILIGWGIVGVPVVIGAILVAIAWLSNRVPR